VVPLAHRVLAGSPTYTYAAHPEGAFDVALVDGPPRRLGNGRLGALLLAYEALRVGGLAFLDDAHRPSELRVLPAFADLTGSGPTSSTSVTASR